MTKRGVNGGFAKSCKAGARVCAWKGIGNSADAIVDLKDFIEIIGDRIVNDVKRVIRGKLVADNSEIVVKFIGDKRDVAITKDKMRNTANNHDAKKSTDWEECGNASIRVVGEKIIPFVENIA